MAARPNLYYIAHVDNIPSILREGILSHRLVEEKQLPHTPVYDQEIVNRRESRQTPDGKSLWDFANLYFQPRNPMLYRVHRGAAYGTIAILQIRPDVMDKPGVLIANGNAASVASELFPVQEGLKKIQQIRKILDAEWWHDTDGSKRQIMAECLTPDLIEPDYIQTIFTPGFNSANRLREDLNTNIPIIPEPYMFFQPHKTLQITSNLFVLDGDMFFSQAQTLTISVNTRGVMGKGLASRAKYQFPDVYVVYQDVCKGRNPKLRPAVPYLYKRESLIDYELADEPFSLPEPNAKKWFLLFATKRHWRDPSRIDDIEQGLQWIRDNYQQEKITSLALPALGCGLGELEWREVGPLMCRYLVDLGIKVRIYLPREQETPAEYLTADFLLS